MKTHILISIVLFSNLGCSPTKIPKEELRGISSPGSDPNLVPNLCNSGQIATTKGGCVGLNKVNQFNFAVQSSIIGFTRYLNSDAVLLERFSGAFKVWDLYALPDSSQTLTNVVPICSLTKPGSNYDSFGGLNYSGGIFHTMAVNVNGMTRIYDISTSNCTATASTVLQVTSDSCSAQTNYLFYDGAFFIYSFNCSLYKQTGAVFNLLRIGTATIAGSVARPESAYVFARSSVGEFWFISYSNDQLWHINQSLEPDAWLQLPTQTYNDLYNVQGIAWTSANHLHLLTMQYQALKVFDFDVTQFSGGQL